MYERFTDRARKVMQLANQEAQRFNHEYIGTEHILLGLIKEGSGVAANVLHNFHVDLRKIRLEVEKLIHSGPDLVTVGKLPQTPLAKKVIQFSMEEAHNLGHNYVGSEHILLGLLREEEGVAARVLINLGLTLEQVRKEVLNLLGSAMEQPEFQERFRPSAIPGFPSGGAIPGPPFVFFTAEARHVMQLANQEAQRFNHEYIGTEHLLLGLVKEQSGVAAKVLKNLQIDSQKIDVEVEKLLQRGPNKVTAAILPQTPRAKKAIEYAVQESHNLGHYYVGTEHILLGLLHEHEGAAAQVLMNLGAKEDAVRGEIQTILKQPEYEKRNDRYQRAQTPPPRPWDVWLDRKESAEKRRRDWIVPLLIVALLASLAVNILLALIILGR